MMGGGTPQLLAGSKIADLDGYVLEPVTENTVDRTPLKKRWGGWYVTGRNGVQPHLGNILVRTKAELTKLDDAKRYNLETLKGLGFLDTKPYLTAKSDIVALMVLEHQITVENQIAYVRFKAPNVLTRIGHGEATKARSWDALPPIAQKALTGMLDRLVRRLTFVDAAAFDDSIAGTAGFEAWFQAQGPRDKQGRSLRTLDLHKRLFKYAVSYLIYSREFDSLPGYAKDYVCMKITNELRGRDGREQHVHPSNADRHATLAILRATMPDFFSSHRTHESMVAH